MNKICDKCGAANVEQARFCHKCGGPLRAEGSGGFTKERTPADQAAELKEKTKHIWKGFTANEKIIFIGAIGMLISFFLPWASSGGQSTNGISAGGNAWYVYLLPLSAIVSCLLLYFSQGATKVRKVLVARWQIIIGTVWASISVMAIIAAISIMAAIQNAMGGFLGAGGVGVDIGIGAYLLAAGSIVIVVGAFRLQKELL